MVLYNTLAAALEFAQNNVLLPRVLAHQLCTGFDGLLGYQRLDLLPRGPSLHIPWRVGLLPRARALWRQ